MKQLDFSDFDTVRTAERQKRFDAFWGPLDEARRAATRVACDFFSFAEEVNWQLGLREHWRASDAEKSDEAFRRAQMYSSIAIEKFRLFGQLTGSKDDAEAIDRLDELIARSRKTGWQVYPDWWTKLPRKNTAYFVGQLKIHAGEHSHYLAMLRKPAKALDNTKGGAA